MQARGVSSPLVMRLVSAIDDRLRRRQGVFEFTAHPRSVVRMQVRPYAEAIQLPDATAIGAGDRIVELHCWNEQLPLLDTGSLRWAREIREHLRFSFSELHRYLEGAAHLSDIRVIRAEMKFGTAQQSAQLLRIAKGFGFEPPVGVRRVSRPQRLHLLGENILISLMVLGRNNAALRRDTLRRDRVEVFISRAGLARHYGAVGSSDGRAEATAIVAATLVGGGAG